MSLTKREAAIITMYTGILIGDFGDAHAYAEEILDRPIWTHQFPDLFKEIKEKSRADFLAIKIEG